MSGKFKLFNLLLARSIKGSKRAVTVVVLAIGLSLGGAMSARAIDIADILRQILAISDRLSQGLQTFAGLPSVPLPGELKLPTTEEVQQAIAGTFGQGNPQANANNLVNNITSMNAAGIANKKIWSKDGQVEQKNITDEGNELDRASYDHAGASKSQADIAAGRDSSQDILKDISRQLQFQAFVSDDQSRLMVIQNSLLQESNLQTSAANGSTASTQEMVAGQAKKKNTEEQEQLVGNLVSIERYLRE